MSTQLNNDHMRAIDPGQSENALRSRVAAGVALIVIGLLIMVTNLLQIPDLGLLFLPILGVIFLAWGLVTRTFGLLIPGGILLGLGVGAYLAEGLLIDLEGEAEAAVILLSFAAGWGLITLLSAFTSERIQLWPLIPGAILALIGGALAAGDLGVKALEVIGLTWPIALIGFGLYLLVRRQAS